MSPRAISFLTSHAEGAWSAHEQRHFAGKPFAADIGVMPFYGVVTGTQSAAASPSGLSRSAEARLRPRSTMTNRLTRSRSASPPRQSAFPADGGHSSSSEQYGLADPRPVSESTGLVDSNAKETAAPQHSGSISSPSPLKKKHRPNALSFLDADSPPVTKESITRVVTEASTRGYTEHQQQAASTVMFGTTSPTAGSSSSPSSSVDSDSSASSDGLLSETSGAGQDNGSDVVTSPETSENGDDEEGDAGSPTPKPTPTYDTGLRIPDFASMAAATAAAQARAQKSHQNQHQHQAHTHHRTPSQAKAHLAAQRKYRAYRYGTPEMPRGTANLPHLPPSALNPRVPNAGHVKHLPRAEKLPLTGYELLASKLSSHSSHVMKYRRGSLGAASTMSANSGAGSSNGSVGCDNAAVTASQIPIKPLYRKFESLNHRILLHLQDELSELEEQLHRLDTADTQTRRLQNSILPASRRAEALAGGELQWHKTDILGKIGYKLGQYNHVLSSFTETQQLASPTLSDISDYRTYLDTQQPIAEIETRFLDVSDDLVTLSSARQRLPSSAIDSPSTSSGSEESLSPSYLQALAASTLAPALRSGSGFRSSLDRPSSPTPSSMSGSSASSLQSAQSSPLCRPTTAIFDQKEPVVRTEVSQLHSELALNKSVMEAASCIPAPSTATALASDDFLHLVTAMAVAVLVPVLTFTVIPGFIGRMAVVLLVAFTVFSAQVQAGTVRVPHDASGTAAAMPRSSSRDLLLCAGVYGAVMAVVAGLCA